MSRVVFPFTAVIGQEKAKKALILNIIDPMLGGVLISGPKGSGKSTIVRALEDILPEIEYVEGCPFNCGPRDPTRLCPSCKERLAEEGKLPIERRRMRIIELPLGASEEALLGAIDPESALMRGLKILQPGLLAKANRNILYIDEVNLLHDHIVDCILDPAASGWNVVQREGVSLSHPARFTLIASMNPEEGGLRPQILDRFALKVETETLKDPKERGEVVRRHLAFEEDPATFLKGYEEDQSDICGRIQRARESLSRVEVPEAVMRGVAEVCSQLGVEGFRSDLSALKAARALAAYEGRAIVGARDITEVFDLALSHRVKWGKPLEKHVIDRTVREVLLIEKIELAEEEISLMPMEEIPPTGPPIPTKRVKPRRRKFPAPLVNIIYILVISGLLISLSAVLTVTHIFLQAMVSGLPLEGLIKTLTLQRFLLNLAIVASIFAALNIFYSRRKAPLIIYFYKYLGSGLKRQIIRQHEYPRFEEGVREDKPIEASKTLNIPLYASLRRLYKMVVGKGAKLLEAGRGEKRRRYRFAVGRRADRRLRSAIGKQAKTKARSERGRYVSYEFPKRRPWDVALGPTIRAAAPFQPSRDRRGLALKVEVEDIRVKVREMRAPICMVLLLDMSESMIPSLANVRNAILSMRDIAMKRRDRLGLTIFKGEAATTLQTPTTNLNLLVNRLMDVGASDLTPLASGIFEAWRVLRNEKVKNRDIIPYLVIISDGIANIPLDSPLSPFTRLNFLNHAQADVIDAAYLLRRGDIRTLVINPSHLPEDPPTRRYKDNLEMRTGKRWLDPQELLMEIPRITGGYYYGIGEKGELEEAILTEAFSIISR